MERLLHILRADESPAIQAFLEESQHRAVVPLTRTERLAEVAVGGGFVAAAAGLVALGGVPSVSVPYVVVLIAAFAAVSLVQFDVGSCYTVPSQLVLVPMLFLLPPAIVPVCVLAALVIAKVPDVLRNRRPWSRVLLAIADSWFAIGPAAVLLVAGSPSATEVTLLVVVAAIGAQFAVDFAASAARLLMTRGTVEREHVEESAWVYAVDLLLWPIGFLAAFAESDRPGTALAVLGLAALLQLFAYERQSRLQHMLELSRAYRGTAVLLGDVVEADHEYTGSHSRSVVDYSTGVADLLGLDSAARRRVEFGALLHDVGKVRVPKSIIDKPGPLDEAEWDVMRRHTVEGEEMLRKVGGTLAEVGRVVRSSHEHFDGTGYPDGLAGDEIPIESRIVTCCDAFSAMTTDRAYRRARTMREAVQELRDCSGSHFDPQVVAALITVLAPVLEREPNVVATVAEPAPHGPAPAIAGSKA